MQLANKKLLAAHVLGVGKGKIVFTEANLAEIKEAITRQDIKDLYNSGAITVKADKGRRKIIRRKHRRGIGKVKKKVKNSKQVYVKLTRKLRSNAKFLLKTGKVDKAKYIKIRKMIKASRFKSKRHLNEILGEI